MSNLAPPSLRLLLRRDYPSQAIFAFTLFFGVGAMIAVAGAAAEPREREFAAIFACVFGLFALGCGIVVVRRLRWIMRLARRAVVVDGTVRRSDANTEDIWFIEVEYEFAGTEYRAKKATGWKNRFAPGDIVRLLVDPERPERAWIAD
jgi:hypothetical protein